METNTSLVLVPKNKRLLAYVKYINYLNRHGYFKPMHELFIIDYLEKL